MSLFLPNRDVHVWYEDGLMESVACTDTLTTDEAEKYRSMWEKARGKKVIRVTLDDGKGNVLKSFAY